MSQYASYIIIRSNLSYLDSCYPGTSLNRAADSLYFTLILQKLWAAQWVWPIIAYVFILHSEIRTNLSYGHPLIPRYPDKRDVAVRTLHYQVIHNFGDFIFALFLLWFSSSEGSCHISGSYIILLAPFILQ